MEQTSSIKSARVDCPKHITYQGCFQDQQKVSANLLCLFFSRWKCLNSKGDFYHFHHLYFLLASYSTTKLRMSSYKSAIKVSPTMGAGCSGLSSNSMIMLRIVSMSTLSGIVMPESVIYWFSLISSNSDNLFSLLLLEQAESNKAVRTMTKNEASKLLL